MSHERVSSPPSGITGPLGAYLRELSGVINDLPPLSYFSGLSPESVITAYPGTVAIGVGSDSNNTRLWVMGGSARVASMTGWRAVNTT